jgi:hypothetical protein
VFGTERHLQWKSVPGGATASANGSGARTAPSRQLQDIVIADPTTQTKLKQAMRLLGRNEVTLYDIARLQAEGYLQDLDPPGDGSGR